MTTYSFQRGETVSLALDAVTGDPATVTSVTAAMKPVAAGRTLVDSGAAVAASFSVTNRVAAGQIPAGWTLTLSAAVSAALAAGTYLADAKLVVAGGVTITEPVAIRMIDAVTP
jgi:glutamine synthetase